MIVCLCKGISDRQIRDMARQGQSLRQIISTCEASTCCGACSNDLKEIIKFESSSPSPSSASLTPK